LAAAVGVPCATVACALAVGVPAAGRGVLTASAAVASAAPVGAWRGASCSRARCTWSIPAGTPAGAAGWLPAGACGAPAAGAPPGIETTGGATTPPCNPLRTGCCCCPPPPPPPLPDAVQACPSIVASKLKSLAGMAWPVESEPLTRPMLKPQQELPPVLEGVKLQQKRSPSPIGLVSDIEKKSAVKVGPAFKEVWTSLPVEESATHFALVPLAVSAAMQLPSHLRSSWTPAT
jgi:hypothetical protein